MPDSRSLQVLSLASPTQHEADQHAEIRSSGTTRPSRADAPCNLAPLLGWKPELVHPGSNCVPGAPNVLGEISSWRELIGEVGSIWLPCRAETIEERIDRSDVNWT